MSRKISYIRHLGICTSLLRQNDFFEGIAIHVIRDILIQFI